MDLGALWRDLPRWVHDLDWGNVPSWLSALSIVVAVAAFMRDKRRHQRRQVDEVTAAGHVLFDAPRIRNRDDSEESEYDPLYVSLYVQNASKLPVRDVVVNYTVRVHWRDRRTRKFYRTRFTRVAWYAQNIDPDTTMKPQMSEIEIAAPPNERHTLTRDASLTITHVYIRDSVGKMWVWFPGSGRAAIPMGFRSALRNLGSGIRRQTQY
ncbi:hypothetical protein [Amycolatopsis sp. lyj-108]|uniref:hypothetical protein n=1 Tax=Amycolatopsis sp. lyj-108 TaxID=2789286 RepID=UPI00397D08D3